MESRKLFKLMSWLSPGFPIGAYTYSHGLEYAVESKLVTDRISLEGWIGEILRHGSGRVDAMLFNAVYRCCGNKLYSVIELASAMRGTSELAQESHMQGQAFLKAIESAWDGDLGDSFLAECGQRGLAIPYVVAVAASCKLHKIPVEEALTAYLQAFTSNLVSAGIRLIPVGHTDGQIILANLENVISGVVEESSHTSLDDLGSSTPMVDWTSMQHENQYTRLFRS